MARFFPDSMRLPADRNLENSPCLQLEPSPKRLHANGWRLGNQGASLGDDALAGAEFDGEHRGSARHQFGVYAIVVASTVSGLAGQVVGNDLGR